MGAAKENLNIGLLAHVRASRRAPRKIPLKYAENRT